MLSSPQPAVGAAAASPTLTIASAVLVTPPAEALRRRPIVVAWSGASKRTVLVSAPWRSTSGPKVWVHSKVRFAGPSTVASIVAASPGSTDTVGGTESESGVPPWTSNATWRVAVAPVAASVAVTASVTTSVLPTLGAVTEMLRPDLGKPG